MLWSVAITVRGDTETHQKKEVWQSLTNPISCVNVPTLMGYDGLHWGDIISFYLNTWMTLSTNSEIKYCKVSTLLQWKVVKDDMSIAQFTIIVFEQFWSSFQFNWEIFVRYLIWACSPYNCDMSVRYLLSSYLYSRKLSGGGLGPGLTLVTSHHYLNLI